MKGLLFSPSAPNWCVLGTTLGASWVRTSLPDFLGPNMAVYSRDTFNSARVSGHEARAPSQVRCTFHCGQLQRLCQPLFWDLTLLEGAQSHVWGSTWGSGGLLAPSGQVSLAGCHVWDSPLLYEEKCKRVKAQVWSNSSATSFNTSLRYSKGDELMSFRSDVYKQHEALWPWWCCQSEFWGSSNICSLNTSVPGWLGGVLQSLSFNPHYKLYKRNSIIVSLLLFFKFTATYSMACGILVPCLGVEPTSLALEAQS